MYAIIAASGRQFKVEPGMEVEMNRLAGDPGDTIVLNDSVMLLQDEAGVQTGSPTLAAVPVELEIVKHYRGTKLIVFKMKRRKSFRRKNGHRQDLTSVLVKRIGAHTVADSASVAAEAVAE